jgi:RNA polymerase-interacting CarD/CdnL/TRCF family regulator
MEFHVGDQVVHWTYGLGQVVGIEERFVADRQVLCYEVATRDLTVWVPADEELEARLRPPTPRDDFKGLFAILTEASEPLPELRKERRIVLLERLRDSRVGSICRLIRDLTGYQRSHTLNDNDQTVMKRSRDALLTEWGYVFSLSRGEVERQLSSILAAGAA